MLFAELFSKYYMICPQCKKQIPDDSSKCAYCGSLIDHEKQVPIEINSRRYQRWFFYALIVFIFLGMIGIIVKVYNVNNDLLSEIVAMEKNVTEKDSELQGVKESLGQTETELGQVNTKLSRRDAELTEKDEELNKKDKELNKKVDKLKKELEEKINLGKEELLLLEEEKNNCSSNLSKANSNIYSLIVNLGIGASNEDINGILIADANLDGEDSDNDGLSDEIEMAIGTDIDKEDTDGDGYTDKNELLNGYSPLGEGIYGDDLNFANEHKGDILLQVDGANEAWYVGGNGKRYFLGNPMNAFESMRRVEYWTKQLPSN